MHVHVRVCLAHCPAGANMNVLIVLPIAIAVHACASQTNKVGNELIPMLVGSLLFLVPWLLLHRSQPPLNLMPVDAGAGTYVHTATPQPPARLAPYHELLCQHRCFPCVERVEWRRRAPFVHVHRTATREQACMHSCCACLQRVAADSLRIGI